MDSITHTLFGVTIYKSIKKEKLDSNEKKALFFTSIVGSQIPDIDVVSKYFDTAGMYQMWHRGITHSIFMVPIWAFLIYLVSYLFWRVKDKRLFFIGLGSVFIHITSDLFNAWGTGYLEPFSSIRLSFGTIPIIDFFVWIIILTGFIVTWIKKNISHDRVFKTVLLIIALHFFIQSAQGYYIYKTYHQKYDQFALSSSFIPWHFKIIGKVDSQVDIANVTVWSKPTIETKLVSDETANLDMLFEKNPKAKTLYAWSPFVVVVNNNNKLGVYDPRFYRDGQSFLFEYIDKKNIE